MAYGNYSRLRPPRSPSASSAASSLKRMTYFGGYDDCRSASSLDIEGAEEEAFSVEDISLKGKGLVATRLIQRGEILFAEAPLLTLPRRPTNTAILAALSRCPREQQSLYFKLSNSHRGRLLPALGIFETNALYFMHEEKAGLAEEKAGLFLLASRLNSSCTPNVSKCWDPVQQVMIFRALRDVHDREELCFNYCDVLGTRDQRRAEIMEERQFTCRCECCELDLDPSNESDKRRSTVARLFEEVGQCGNEPMLGVRKIKLALQLLKKECLLHYEASFCYDAFQYCVMVSDFSNAKNWIRRAWEVSCCTSGPESDTARMFKTYWANPRAHELAGALHRMSLSGPDSKLSLVQVESPQNE